MVKDLQGAVASAGVNARRSPLATASKLLPLRASQKAVGKQWVPDYHEVVKEQMHFDKIANRIRNRSYRTKEEFVRDIKLIHDNAVAYNKPENGGKFGSQGEWRRGPRGRHRVSRGESAQ